MSLNTRYSSDAKCPSVSSQGYHRHRDLIISEQQHIITVSTGLKLRYWLTRHTRLLHSIDVHPRGCHHIFESLNMAVRYRNLAFSALHNTRILSDIDLFTTLRIRTRCRVHLDALPFVQTSHAFAQEIIILLQLLSSYIGGIHELDV